VFSLFAVCLKSIILQKTNYMRYLITTFLLLAFATLKLQAQNMYACFENDANKNLQISVYFGKTNKAMYVLYKGQKRTIKIAFVKRENEDNPGGHPRTYWADTYNERLNGKITGTYTFTNAGTHNLDVTYKRKKDKKEFYFKIIEGSMDSDNAVYRSTPCFD
jgi:hypothetical protein